LRTILSNARKEVVPQNGINRRQNKIVFSGMLSIAFRQGKFKLYLPVPRSFPARPSPMGNF